MINPTSQFRENMDAFIQPAYGMVKDYLQGIKAPHYRIKKEGAIKGSLNNLETAFALLHRNEIDGIKIPLLPIKKDFPQSTIFDDDDHRGSHVQYYDDKVLAQEDRNLIVVQSILEFLRNLPRTTKQKLKEPIENFLKNLQEKGSQSLQRFAELSRDLWTFNLKSLPLNLMEKAQSKAVSINELISTLQLPAIKSDIDQLMTDVRAVLFPKAVEQEDPLLKI